MSGHSKWSTIKHKKGAKDAKRGKIFTKLIKEITVAARLGGGDVKFNPRLRTAVLTARQNSMPADNIDRAIKKGTGELEGVHYEEIAYEGYAPGGAALYIEVVTDNANRTVAALRNILERHGGHRGTSGSVAWQFERKGHVYVSAARYDEDKVLEAALDAGAEDVVRNDDSSVEVICEPADFTAVKNALAKAGFAPALADITMKPTAENVLKGEEGGRMQKLLDALENLDDVQDVYTTAVIDQ